MDLYMKNTYMALATVAQLVECPLTKGKVASSISRRAQAWVVHSAPGQEANKRF